MMRIITEDLNIKKNGKQHPNNCILKPIKMNKLQNLIIDITVPLAWMLILSAAFFAVVLLPQIIFVAVCDCQPTF